jgi:hypothetical protein
MKKIIIALVLGTMFVNLYGQDTLKPISGLGLYHIGMSLSEFKQIQINNEGNLRIKDESGLIKNFTFQDWFNYSPLDSVKHWSYIQITLNEDFKIFSADVYFYHDTLFLIREKNDFHALDLGKLINYRYGSNYDFELIEDGSEVLRTPERVEYTYNTINDNVKLIRYVEYNTRGSFKIENSHLYTRYPKIVYETIQLININIVKMLDNNVKEYRENEIKKREDKYKNAQF